MKRFSTRSNYTKRNQNMKRRISSSVSGDGRAEDDQVNLQLRNDMTNIKQQLLDFEDFCFDTLDNWVVPESDRKSIWRHIVSIRNTLDNIIEESHRHDLLPYE